MQRMNSETARVANCLAKEWLPLVWLTNGSDSIFEEHSLLLQFLWWVEREGKNEGGREGREEGKREEGKEGVRINEGPRREGGEEGKRGGSSRRV